MVQQVSSPLTSLFALVLFGAAGCQKVPDNPFDPPTAGFDDGGLDDEEGAEAEGNVDDSNEEEDSTAEANAQCEPGIADGCPSGQKCNVVQNASGQLDYRCTSIPEGGGFRPPLPFERCDASLRTGEDRCPKGHGCLPNDPGDRQNGLCLPLCLSDSDCLQEACLADPISGIPTCMPFCDPVQTICPEPLQCIHEAPDFVCQVPSIQHSRGAGDECRPFEGEYCGASLICIEQLLLPDCSEQSCCTPACSLDSEESNCPSETTCVAISEGNPTLDQVGACILPLDSFGN